MTCKHCGEPLAKETRSYRGMTGYVHWKGGRLWCLGEDDRWHKAEPE